MAIYRVRAEVAQGGREYYVEDHQVPDWIEHPQVDYECVYVVTRSEYATSLFGQIESVGWIDASKLDPLDEKRKKDREIIQRIRDVEREGIERSEMWYNLAKANQSE